jgi:signal transduction histidine kinase
MEFNPEHFEMEAFINEATLLMDDIARQKSINIKKVLPRNVYMFADKAMINTVFRNLISNAIKFTMPGGRITISAEVKQREIVFLVSDTGIGIPKNSIEKIFRIEQSYSTPGTNKEKGTGLGLILCKEFVEKHGGKIWVESEEGTGSTFYFTLPCIAV